MGKGGNAGNDEWEREWFKGALSWEGKGILNVNAVP